MKYKRLFIWIEGANDLLLFDKIIKPVFNKKYNYVQLIQYANRSTKWKINFLKSIKAMNADYIYTRDINNAPCITAKKQEIQDKIDYIDNDRIVLIIKEIESWYLAGLNNKDAQKLKIPLIGDTDNIDKEQFNNLIPRTFDSRIDFMLEILKYFSLEIAKKRNKSFKYFLKKYNF